MFFFRPAVKLASLLVTGLSVAWAQTAQIAGTITDPTGAVIATADITITRLETSLERKTASNAKGRYAVPLLPPGRYRVSVQHDDFVPVNRSGILLSADQNVRLDFSLEVGRVTEQITEGRSKFGPLRRSKSRPVGEGVAVFVGRLERSLRSPFRAAQA